MISSTQAVAWPGSIMLGGHNLDCSSGMVVDSSNWLAIGVVGKTNFPSSPRLITLCCSWAPFVPAH